MVVCRNRGVLAWEGKDMAVKGLAVTSLSGTTFHLLVRQPPYAALEERLKEHQEVSSTPKHSWTTPGILKGEEGEEMESAAISG